MKKREWLDKISDSELSNLLNKDFPVKEVPHFLDKKLIKMINNKEEMIEERKKYLRKFIFRLVLSGVLAFFIILTIPFVLGLFLPFLHQNNCIVINIKGEAYKYFSYKNRLEKIEKNFKIKPKTGLITKLDSVLNLKIGGHTFSEIRENFRPEICHSI